MADGSKPTNPREQAIDLWATGKSARAIGELLGYHARTARHWIEDARRKGDPRTVSRRTVLPDSWAAEKIEKLCALWIEGLTCSQIAAALGTTRNAVIGKARRLGLPAKPSPIKALGSWPPEKRDYLRSLWATGLSCSKIAVLMGTTKGAVSRQACTLNLPRRALSARDAARMGGLATRAKQGAKPKTKRAPKRLAFRPDAVQHFQNVAHVAAFPASKNIPLMEITDSQCKFMEGDPGDPKAGFCGNPARLGTSWCPYHQRLVWRPQEKRTAKLIKSLLTGAFA